MLPPVPTPLILAREEPALVRRLGAKLHRVRPGVYADAARWRVLEPWRRYLLRVHAVLLTWDEPVVCLESAAALIGLPIFDEPRHIHLLSADAVTRRRGDVVVHGARDGRRLVVVDGVRATSVTETAADLARVLPPAFALAVADAALRLLGPEAGFDISAHGRDQQNRRGVIRLDWVGRRASGLSESVGESVSRAAIEWLGYEPPALQVEFRGEGVADRVDFHFPDADVIGESDGYGKYDASDPEAMKAHFVREKTREDRLRRQVSGFARWDWSDTIRWSALDAKLRASGLTPVRPRSTSFLSTLTSNPRSLPRSRTVPIPPKRT